jgi:2-oxoisovalerate dehydrogenase E1 component alpha subunit
MATGSKNSKDNAVQGVFNSSAGQAEIPIHLPLDHVDVGKGTITATIASPSVGDGGLAVETLREMYRYVALARALDERIWQLNRTGQAPFVVSGQGHEAAQVAAAFALDRSKDIILPYYRDLALCLVQGLTAHDVMMSVLAKGDDPISGSRQMPGHYGSAKLRIISGSSVVATQLPQATGTAYAAKMRKTGQVSLVSFGEGASSKGDFHEACNFAGIHDLPVVLFLQKKPSSI